MYVYCCVFCLVYVGMLTYVLYVHIVLCFRYVLDGDREELRLIRQDVNNLKQLSAHNIGREEYFRGDM